MIKQILFFSIYLIAYLVRFSGFAQTTQTDSLYAHILKLKADTNKVNSLNNIAEEYESHGEIQKSIKISEGALQLAQQLKHERGIAKSYILLGYAHEDLSDNEKALLFYTKALKFYRKISDKSGISNALNNIGNAYRNLAKYPQALENYLFALKLREEINDTLGIGKCYVSLGNVYLVLKNNDKAITYYKKALSIFEPMGNTYLLANTYGNFAIACYNKNEMLPALEYQIKALKLNKLIGNKVSQARCYTNIGNIYLKQNNVTKAIDFHSKSLRLAQEIEEESLQITCLVNLATDYVLIKQYQKALETLLPAEERSKKIADLDNLQNIYEIIAKAQAALKNYNKAYEYQLLFKQVSDSIFNIENSKILSDAKTVFEVEKKEAELNAIQAQKDAITNTKLERQSIIRNGFMVGFTLMFLLVFVTYRSYRRKRKDNELILQQKTEVETQKLIVENKNKEITDSINYAKRIQFAKLPSINDIKKALPNSFVLYKPKDIVSGDFYYFQQIEKENSIYIAAADCTGHGVPGALMSMISSDKLDEAIQKHRHPADILQQVNSAIKTTLKQSDNENSTRDGMDIAFCKLILNNTPPNNVHVQFSGANRPLYCITKNQNIHELTEIKPTKKAIGGFTNEHQPFECTDLKMATGDTIYLCTDGYADTFGGQKGKKVTTKKLKQLLLEIQSMDMNEQEIVLNDFIEKWKNETEQIDDILIIGIRF
jgi:tetratricopeptide (TPR) repeat protein/serine phosphatase RsbU (regulator of sigma subunit)